MIEYKDLKQNQRSVILVLIITLPFVYTSLFFINKDLVVKNPFYISMVMAFCITMLISAFNSVNSLYLNSKLGCFEGEVAIIGATLLSSVGWVSLWSFLCFTFNFSFYCYICYLIIIPFIPAFIIFTYSIVFLFRDSRRKNNITNNVTEVKSKIEKE